MFKNIKSTKMVAICLTFLVSFFAFCNFADVDALSGKTKRGSKRCYGTGNESYKSGQHLIVVNGESRVTFCLDYYKDWEVGKIVKAEDGVNYYSRNRGITKTKAQKKITKAAIYKYYIYTDDLHPDIKLTSRGKEALTQMTTWRILDGHSSVKLQTVDKDDRNTNTAVLWGEGTPRKSKSEINNFQNQVYNGAKAYYNAHQNEFIGKSVVWKYNSSDQATIELDVVPINAGSYKCEFSPNDSNKCSIIHYDGSGQSTYVKVKIGTKPNGDAILDTNINCTDGSGKPISSVIDESGISHNLDNTCPIPPRYKCEESLNDGYGKCKIVNAVNGEVQEVINCNSFSQNGAKWNGKTLEGVCPFKPKYNYDIDVACEGCDDKNTEGSYHIQDTSDWEAIIHSVKRTDNGELAGYYKKGNGILCRDEFHVVLPNGNNTSKVYAVRGSRITVNGSGMFSINGVYNFESIKVTRTRECLSTGGNLNSLTNLTDSDMGKINLNYIADSYSNKFTGDLALVVDTSYKAIGGVNTSTINVNSRWPSEVVSKGYSVRKDTLTRYFKLTDDVYRWVTGGKAELKKPTDTSKYLDVGESNLPVSFVNNKDVIVQLNYQVPENSNLYKAVKAGKVDYLGTHSEATEKDIYNNGGISGAKNNPFADSASNKSTACAKMYGYNTGPYKTCINDRFNKSKTCISQFTTKDNPAKGFGGNSSQIYSCTIKNCSTKEDAEKAKVPWNEKGQYCCPAGTVYNPTTGTCDTNLCRIENGKYYDDNNHEITKDEFDRKCTCQILPNGNYILDDGKTKTNDYSKFRKACPICKLQNGKYYGKYGKVVTKEVYNKECPAGKCVVVGEPECPPSTWINNDPCIRCPYTGLCPMPGGVCPTPDGRDIIYRPIDLIDPFPGQSASTRNTGTNWCSYDIKNSKLICNGKPADATSLGKDGNPIVYTDIIDNRGTKGYTVYDKNPLYSVELDANAIKQIQKYNAGNSYDDWSNITYSDAVGSKSSFVHSSKYGFTLSNDSECKNIGNGNLKTCAER